MSGRIKVLLIDDEEDFNHFVKLNLENTGDFEIRTTENPLESVTLARQYHPDIVLLDIFMPEMDGPTVAENLLDNPETRDIPIIFLTALVKQDELKKGSTIAGRTYIAKPVATDDLIRQIKAILKR